MATTTMVMAFCFSMYLHWIMPISLLLMIPVALIFKGSDAVGWRRSAAQLLGKNIREDSILMSESVQNWMTVQSLCAEEQIFERYDIIVRKTMMPSFEKFHSSLLFGLSMGFRFILMGALFSLMQ